jgi:nucleoside-diphosphate-sugar epimerase
MRHVPSSRGASRLNVFVAGASGVIGPPLIPMLHDAGHRVTALTRTKSKANALAQLGADPVVCDVFDEPRIRAAVASAAAEVIIHQLTALPRAINPRKVGDDLAATNRLRTEGTQNLIRAAQKADVRRVVAQSIAFAYAPGGRAIKSEEDPLYLDAPGPGALAVRAVKTLEETVLGADGIEGVVLRYGYWYGSGTAYAREGFFAERTRRRQLPIVGDGGGVFSFVHIDDVASATVAALQGIAGVFNVVDDDPAPVREWLPYYAQCLGAKPPRRVPEFLARLIGGDFAIYTMTEQPGASNERIKAALDWTPRFSSWRQGFRGLSDAVTTQPRSPEGPPHQGR